VFWYRIGMESLILHEVKIRTLILNELIYLTFNYKITYLFYRLILRDAKYETTKLKLEYDFGHRSRFRGWLKD